MGGRIDPAGIDPEPFAVEHRGALRRRDFGADIHDLAILNEQRAALQRRAGYRINVRVLNQNGFVGRQGGRWSPHVSPVSTAFTLQALAMWEARQTGGVPDRCLLI